MSTDNLDTMSDLDLNALFAKEIAGLTQRTEGLFWSDEKNRVYILAGSALHDFRKRMELPCEPELMLAFATDANAVLPFMEKLGPCFAWPNMKGRWIVSFKRIGAHDFTADSTSFARAAVIALIRAKRNGSGP